MSFWESGRKEFTWPREEAFPEQDPWWVKAYGSDILNRSFEDWEWERIVFGDSMRRYLSAKLLERSQVRMNLQSLFEVRALEPVGAAGVVRYAPRMSVPSLMEELYGEGDPVRSPVGEMWHQTATEVVMRQQERELAVWQQLLGEWSDRPQIEAHDEHDEVTEHMLDAARYAMANPAATHSFTVDSAEVSLDQWDPGLHPQPFQTGNWMGVRWIDTQAYATGWKRWGKSGKLISPGEWDLRHAAHEIEKETHVQKIAVEKG